MIRLLPRCQKVLKKLAENERKAFNSALRKLEATPVPEQTLLLRPLLQKKCLDLNVQFSMRSSHKYRVLLSRDGRDFVVADIVSRGDKRYYKSE